jgi:hypothetical protein
MDAGNRGKNSLSAAAARCAESASGSAGKAGQPHGIGKIAQGAATLGERLLEHLTDGRMQAIGAWPAEPVGAQGGPDTGHEKRLAGVDVADADHHLTGQQDLLDGRFLVLERAVESLRLKLPAQRLYPQPRKQLARRLCALVLGKDDRAKAARVVQPERALGGDQVEVIVPSWRRQALVEQDTARHAQVQQQHARGLKVDQQVLATPTHTGDRASGQVLAGAAQRPAQRLAQAGGLDTGTGDTAGKTQSGDLDFGQFRHAQSNWEALT